MQAWRRWRERVAGLPIVSQSVFGATLDQPILLRLVAWFNRATVCLYLLYAAWGLVATMNAIPSVNSVATNQFQLTWTLCIAITAAASGLAATWFPRLAKLEMYTAGSLIGLVLFYTAVLGWRWLGQGDPGAAAAFILSWTYTLVPAVRVGFIFRALRGDR